MRAGFLSDVSGASKLWFRLDPILKRVKLFAASLCLLLISAPLAVAEKTEKSKLLNTIDEGKSDVMQVVWKVWNFQLFTLKDHPVYVSQFVLAIALFAVGLVLSKWIAKRIRNYVSNNFKLDENSVLFIQRVAYYFLLAIVVLATLQTINIPITMFAFLGGAIIIGVGFGAQHIFSNFFSGMILMIERPVRIGDIIEVDEHLGMIQDIGARCARMRRFDGIEVLIPNSKLLENNVVNRTLSDNLYRTTVTVGVAYGSPVKEVERILLEIAGSHPKVMNDQPFDVYFQEFGDNSLLFELFFWLEARRMADIRRIRSDIRFSIDEKFNEAGITIAFPQRDTHLDTLKPLEVKLLKPE